ncbi:sigma-54 dependent transcriptional regulator [Franzmannia qiaohouensis]|uniref:Sigma-54 dependent transcriptional regulator n=1 Tax=Franzmannia qiaohouensis TaxID=1329370 RepID=A0ABU1HAP3_9GAMM|nr:sigma-54 dependent transcriptional regulator [Halomonas qiaohouensis]MDR5903919.1 sigma-54 dependent transcriptional regulator [Halomonas qiaohouensis]
MVNNRSLATLGQGVGFSEIIKKLSFNHGWAPYPYGAVEKNKSVENKPIRVGLVLIDQQTVYKQQKTIELRHILSGSSLYWLAILDGVELKTNTTINCILDQFCHGYATLPCTTEKVHNLLVNLDKLHEWQDSKPLSAKVDVGRARMIGSPRTTGKLFERIARFANVDAPVLVHGETGTGKELAARAIHESSARSHAPFVAVNCGALPEGLAQSELYGCEKGAFTGAHQQRKGYIETASGGTLFLDEIGDLPLAVQANLLRFLENKRMMRVGGRKEFFVDVRIIAATHVNLRQAVAARTFRDDLYHRLNVLEISLPPLRERVADIAPLAEFFYSKYRKEGSCKLQGISQETFDIMRSHTWPGNIRELSNRIRQAMLYSDSPLLRPTDMGLDRRHWGRYITSLELVRNQAEYLALRESLANHSYDLVRVASELMISKVTLHRLMEKHGLKYSRLPYIHYLNNHIS